ncbi:hypothetical protein V8E55_003124 [Tylopilus felleus]
MPSGGSLTADQWLLLATVYAPILIPQLWAACLPDENSQQILNDRLKTIAQLEAEKRANADRKDADADALKKAKVQGKEAFAAEKARIAREKAEIAERKKADRLRAQEAKKVEKARIAAEKKALKAQLAEQRQVHKPLISFYDFIYHLDVASPTQSPDSSRDDSSAPGSTS